MTPSPHVPHPRTFTDDRPRDLLRAALQQEAGPECNRNTCGDNAEVRLEAGWCGMTGLPS